MEPYEEDELTRTLREFISIDKDLEIAKETLSLKTDFNLVDSFKLFDVDGKGQINIREFEEGVMMYNIYPRREDL